MTQTSAVIGTAQYLSPEQARGETVDARSDVYSTGCLLYELLCGHPPFTGDNPVSVAYQHVREDPIPPSEINRDVTPEIDAIVLKAMAKNPVNRYQSAGEMRADLMRAAAGRPVAAPPVYSPEERTQIIGSGGRRGGTGMIPTGPVEQPRKRRGLTYVLIALGVVAVFALAAWGTSYLLGGNSQKVAVPPVVGKPVAQAKSLVEQQGLKVTIVPQTSPPAQKDKVMSQTPNGNEEVEKGTTVTLYVGKGPDTTKVPDLDGLPRAGAEQALAQAKLKGNFTPQPSAEPLDKVLSFTPKAGEVVEVNSTVNVVVSDGSLKKVPDVVDLTEDQARSKLRKAGFRRVSVIFETRTDKTSGLVFAQNPAQNTAQEQDTIVTIRIAKAPVQTPTPTPTPTVTIPIPTETPSETPSPPT
jgi:serine/threonine-protein kinase